MAKSTPSAVSEAPDMSDMPETPKTGSAPGAVSEAGKAVVPSRHRGALARAEKAVRHVTPAPIAQQHLLDAAVELFHSEGVRAVGVDAVVKRAGVNKMSLYRQFASKDDLILAYLDHMQTASLARIDESIAKHPGQPEAQMLQIFVDLSVRASKPGYRGCPFVNVAAEFPDPEHAARHSVVSYKAEVVRRFTALVTAAGLQDPAPLVDALCLILEGAYAASQTFGPGTPPLLILPTVARQIIDAGMAGKLSAP